MYVDCGRGIPDNIPEDIMVLCMSELEALNLRLQTYAEAEKRGDEKTMKRLFPLIAAYDDYTPGMGLMARYLTGTKIYPKMGVRVNNNNIKKLENNLYLNAIESRRNK